MNRTVRRRRKKKESLTPVIAALIALILIVVVLIAVVIGTRYFPKEPVSTDTDPGMQTTHRDDPETGLPPVTETQPHGSEPETAPGSETRAHETTPPETRAPETTPPETKSHETEPPAPTYRHDYVGSLPESARVPDDWFKDALFIGDSRTVGLASYSGVESTYFGRVSLNISTAFTTKFLDDETHTILEAIENNPKYKKVYIWFGLNDLGSNPASFCKSYKKLLDGIINLLPDAQIYVQSVIPVSEEYAAKSKYGVTNENCVKINTEIAKMCAGYESGVYFLNTAKAFSDQNGVLKGGISNDGAHLNKNAVLELFEYFRTHAVL